MASRSVPVPAGGSAGGGFPIATPLGKSTMLPETAFGCFSLRGAGEARLFPRRKPLPKLAWSEPENSEGEFPVLGISHLPEEPSGRFGGASRRACRRCRRPRQQFPGTGRKRERSRRMLSHWQAGGADRRWGPCRGVQPGCGRANARHCRNTGRPRASGGSSEKPGPGEAGGGQITSPLA